MKKGGNSLFLLLFLMFLVEIFEIYKSLCIKKECNGLLLVSLCIKKYFLN